jgi:hypothetical protein
MLVQLLPEWQFVYFLVVVEVVVSVELVVLVQVGAGLALFPQFLKLEQLVR